MKKYLSIFLLSLMILVVGISKYLGDLEISKRKEIKMHPTKFSYFKYDSGVSLSLVSSDKECMKKIQKYYSSVSKGDKVYLPSCFEHGIRNKDTVYVLSLDQDSVSALVSVFYKSPKGEEKYFTGYVLRSTLHSKPYSKD